MDIAPSVTTYQITPDGSTALQNYVTVNVASSPSFTFQGAMSLSDGATSAFVLERSIDGITYSRVSEPISISSSVQSAIVGMTDFNAPWLRIYADASNVGTYIATATLFRF